MHVLKQFHLPYEEMLPVYCIGTLMPDLNKKILGGILTLEGKEIPNEMKTALI